jgi:hypothetical protein
VLGALNGQMLCLADRRFFGFERWRQGAPLASGSAPHQPLPEPVPTREASARAARISSNTINQIEKIQKSATPEMVAALKSGTISINAAATVATLPLDA